jgi:Glycoside hydrolase family 5 C-terminal domain
MEAFVRPCAIATAGTPVSQTFDLANCSFQCKFLPTTASTEEPTEIFIPDYFFRGGAQPEVSVTSGRWEMVRKAQVLRWWHEGEKEQTFRISSGYRHTGMVESVDDTGYYLTEWANMIYTNCIVS